MAKKTYPPTAERIRIFLSAWREIAPLASFAGMTLAEFETQTAPLALSNQKLQALDAQYVAELKAREEADTAAPETLLLVAHAVRGTACLTTTNANQRKNHLHKITDTLQLFTAPWASCP